MFKVGIYEDLIISKVTTNDKGSLVVGVKKAQEIDPITALNSSGDVQLEADENDFLIYPFKTVNYQQVKLKPSEIAAEIANVKDPLNHILQQFLTAEKITWDIFKETGINTANYDAKLTDQATLDKIYKNIASQFIAMSKPFIGDTTKKLRGVFPRQSVAKHYPTLRKRYLKDFPIFEPMSIPASASKIRFSPYEIEKKLNLADAVQPTQQASKEDAQAAASLFKK